MNIFKKLFPYSLCFTSACSMLYAETITVSLDKATIPQLQKAMEQGTLTSEQLIEMYLERVAAYDKQGPNLNSILHLNSEALSVARALDEERKATGPRSLLHGIPIIPKDNYDTIDMPTTGGFRGLEGSIPNRDAYTIRRLREAGAIILAKANLDEFNSGSSGTSGLGGQVLNPYNLNKSPGGSSAGSGAAIAAVFGQVGLGTETGSSIRNPSTKNNLVGIAPTLGLVSRHGVLPSSILLDRTGPMARNVTDAAIVLSAISGMDAGDLITAQSLGKFPLEGYLDSLDSSALRKARIGVLRENFGSDPEDEEGLAVIDEAIAKIKESGAVMIDPLPTGLDWFTLLRDISSGGGERKEALAIYLTGRGDETPVKSLKDIIDTDLALGKLKSGLERAEAAPPLYANPDYISFARNRAAFQELLIELYDRYDLDAIIYPYQTKPEWTIAEAAPEGGAVSGAPNYDVLGRGTRVSTASGFPAITVPAGFTESDGMPIGLEWLGRPWDEEKLIRLTYAYEQAYPQRKLPETTPRFDQHIVVFEE